MKRQSIALFASFLLVTLASAQTKNNGSTYGGIYAGLTTTGPKPAGGLFFGYAFRELYGFGANVEAVGTKTAAGKTKAIMMFLGELRLIAPATKNFRPSIAFQAGVSSYSDGYITSGISSTISGKEVIGGNLQLAFMNKSKKAGAFIGYSYRSVKFKAGIKYPTSGGIVSTSGNTTTGYHVIAVGFTF